MITLLAFVGAIALLVVFHEYGHYWAARRCGVKVLRFSLGFGNVIYSKRFADSDTEWVISSVPLGGYVKMVDEREEAVAPEDLPYAFNRKPVLQRMAIVAAGPLANFLLAIVLYWGLFVHGVPGLIPKLGDVPPGTPAAIAQMQAGETILSINGEPVPSWQELHWVLLELALNQGKVRIEAQNAGGAPLIHSLDMSGIEAKDLDGDFLDKLGLHLYQRCCRRQCGTTRRPAEGRPDPARQRCSDAALDGCGGCDTGASRTGCAAGCSTRHIGIADHGGPSSDCRIGQNGGQDRRGAKNR
jgi:regulator of sigma E protease